jgi:hypothetical protein
MNWKKYVPRLRRSVLAGMPLELAQWTEKWRITGAQGRTEMSIGTRYQRDGI